MSSSMAHRKGWPMEGHLTMSSKERDASGAMINARSRVVLHERLQNVLVELISDDVKKYVQGARTTTEQMPSEVLTNYVASTFVLVLNWWVETDSPMAATEVTTLSKRRSTATREIQRLKFHVTGA